MTEHEDKIYKHKCPVCGREISSLSEKQSKYNFYTHLNKCESKIKGELNGEVKSSPDASLKEKGK